MCTQGGRRDPPTCDGHRPHGQHRPDALTAGWAVLLAVADVVTTSGFPETPAKQLFMQVAIADDEVPNVGSEYQARTMGVPLILPSPVMPIATAEVAR